MHLLLSIGLLVVYLGLVLAYAVGFTAYSNAVQLISPFVFPAVTLAAAIVVQRSGRVYWMREAIAVIAFASLVGATMVSALGAQSHLGAGWISGCALVWAIAAVASMRTMQDLRAPWDLLVVAIVVGVNTRLLDMGLDTESFRWVNLGLSIGCAVVAVIVAQRQWRRPEEAFATAAVVTSYVATLNAIGNDDLGPSLTGWHLVISLAVACAFVLAPALRMPLLYLAAAGGALLWLLLVIPIAAKSAGWALLVVLMGVVLIAVSIIGTQLRGRFSAGTTPNATLLMLTMVLALGVTLGACGGDSTSSKKRNGPRSSDTAVARSIATCIESSKVKHANNDYLDYYRKSGGDDTAVISIDATTFHEDFYHIDIFATPKAAQAYMKSSGADNEEFVEQRGRLVIEHNGITNDRRLAAMLRCATQ